MKLEKEINYYIVKEWAELSEAEKEREIENNAEMLVCNWNDLAYEYYKEDIEDIKDRYSKKGITFTNVYLDSNSQGWWVDSIEDLKADRNIEIFGEYLEVYDIDIKIRKYIELEDISLNDYYIEEAKLKRIENTKKYKDFMASLKQDLEDMFEEINKVARTYFENENNVDRDFITNAMEQDTYSFKITEEEYNRLKAEGVK